eukprot:02380.XXX_25120_25254_1 [CDS] Oithona nana genome sequencing.
MSFQFVFRTGFVSTNVTKGRTVSTLNVHFQKTVSGKFFITHVTL